MTRRNSRTEKVHRRKTRAVAGLDPSTPVDLLETVELLHRHLDESLCQAVFERVRRRERQREWTLHALAQFWTEVILRAPQALTQALQEAAQGIGGYPKVEATEEAFFQRCKNLRRDFFENLFAEFNDRVLDDAPPVFASEVSHLQRRFSQLLVIDGSRLDAIAHRLKILWDTRSAILPGCLLVAYDLFRGIPRLVKFEADAAAGELPRAHRLLEEIPQDALVLADRLYASVALFEKLKQKGLWGVFKRDSKLKIRRLKCFSRAKVEGGGTLEDWLVEVGCGATAPKQTLRLIRLKRGKTVYEILTNLLDRRRLSASDVMNLYPHRWSIERMFFDLKEVLNLHRLYAGNPNAIAMQIYAAAIVYTAMRVAQAHVAQKLRIAPERISPEKFFVRVAAASAMVTGAQLGFAMVRQANPRRKIKVPPLRGQPFVTTTVGTILVEERHDHRRKRRFCESRRQWKSFKHVPGGRQFLK